MSSKIMQRGLVLGALMAFVITGSAMAAGTIENQATGLHAVAIGFNNVEASKADTVAIGNAAKAKTEAAIAMGYNASSTGNASIALGRDSNATTSSATAIGDKAKASGVYSNAIGVGAIASAPGSTAIGTNSNAVATYSTAVGTNANATGHSAVAIGERVTAGYIDVAIGQGASANAVSGGAIAIGVSASADYESSTAIGRLSKVTNAYSSAYGANSEAIGYRTTALGYKAVANNDYDVAIGSHSIASGVNQVEGTINIGGANYNIAGTDAVGAVSFGGGGSSSSGISDVKRQLQKVAAGQVSATSTDAVNGSQLYAAYQAIDSVVDTTTQHNDRITELESSEVIQNKAISDNSKSIAGLNHRLDKTNTRLDKVGAGAAALAALHPLEYDPDDKLTFSVGMGNYSGENAAALGAFYRPNEKLMFTLGGTMGNGENMVNVGMSIGLDKPNDFAKMSKRELIQEVTAVKAENEAMKAEMVEMKEMLQKLLAKN